MIKEHTLGLVLMALDIRVCLLTFFYFRIPAEQGELNIRLCGSVLPLCLNISCGVQPSCGN